MATISSQSKRSIGGAKWYFTNNLQKRSEHREYVGISATNGALVGTFFEQMELSHERFGKDKHVGAFERGKYGTFARDDKGNKIPKIDKKGRRVKEPKYVQYYSLVQGFGLEELDPDDPDDWERAQELGRAVAEADIFDGHMALVVTEVGGNGKLHNHILIDAVNKMTGKSLNSSKVTHHRLAKTHDRVLEKKDFKQREDMLTLAAEVEARQVAGEKGFSYRKVATQTREVLSEVEERQDERHQVWVEKAALARDRGEPLQVEPFSVAELKLRAAKTLSDPRATSWDQLQSVARENHLTISKRGNDVTFGMMRQQADGSWAEPAKTDRRRGSKLGADLTVDRVQEAVERNDAGARGVTETVQPKPGDAPVPYRSGLHDLAAKPGPKQQEMQIYLDSMASFDEKYAEAFSNGQFPDAEFEKQSSDLKISRQGLDSTVGQSLDAEVRAQLELREDARDASRSLSERSDAQSAVQLKRVEDHIKRGEYSKAAAMRPMSAREQMYQKAQRTKAAERDQGLSL